MAFRLVSLDEGVGDIPIDRPVVFVGRHQECDVRITSRKISRQHCCIAQVNGQLLVRDLFSTNGVRINGVRVDEGQVNVGDELFIANLRYQVAATKEGQPAPVNGAADTQPAQVLASEADLDQPVAFSDDSEPREAPTERALIVPISSEHELRIKPR
jgi:pSer/pThr/pTyr-binding forkhead associated (FHA) protein